MNNRWQRRVWLIILLGLVLYGSQYAQSAHVRPSVISQSQTEGKDPFIWSEWRVDTAQINEEVDLDSHLDSRWPMDMRIRQVWENETKNAHTQEQLEEERKEREHRTKEKKNKRNMSIYDILCPIEQITYCANEVIQNNLFCWKLIAFNWSSYSFESNDQ